MFFGFVLPINSDKIFLAIDELSAIEIFARCIKIAPFASLVHMAPYHYCSGFSHYWYEHHLPLREFMIQELTPNGDWFAYLWQELMRLGSMERRYGNWSWPLAYVLGLLGVLYFKIRGGKLAEDLACFGWQCLAARKIGLVND